MLNKTEKVYNDVVNKIFHDEIYGEKKYTKKEIQHMLEYDYAYRNNDPDMRLLVEYTRGKVDSNLTNNLKSKIHLKYYNRTNNMAKDIRENFDRIDRRYSN
jgi:hypothetical protein